MHSLFSFSFYPRESICLPSFSIHILSKYFYHFASNARNLQQVNLILDSPIPCDIIYTFTSALLCSHKSFLIFVLKGQYLKYLYIHLSFIVLLCIPSQSLIFPLGKIFLRLENFTLVSLIVPYSGDKPCQGLFVGKYLYFGLSLEVYLHLGIISLGILFFFQLFKDVKAFSPGFHGFYWQISYESCYFEAMSLFFLDYF